MRTKGDRGYKYRRKAQTFLEYSFLIAVTVAALIVMHNYMNRSLQGKLKESVDAANPTGDYTTIAGRGHLNKTKTSFIWENKKGHQITWRSTWTGDNFTIDQAAELPFPPTPVCEGAECELLLVENTVAASAIGVSALAVLGGNESPLGDGGTATDVSPGEAEALEELAMTIEGEDTDGDEVGDTGVVQQFNNPTIVDSTPGIVNTGEVSIDNPSSADPVVDSFTASVVSSGTAPGWAVPLLTED